MILVSSIALALTMALLVELVALASGYGFSQTRFLLVYIVTTEVSVIASVTRSTGRKKKN